MNIELPADIAQQVRGLVASGQFETSDEAIAEGVRLLISRQQLHADIQQGIDELDSGKRLDGDLVFAELRERAKKLTEPAE